MFLQKARGQSLIETIITVLIIAGAVIALLRFQNYLAYSNGVTQQQTDAIMLALNKIESLRDYSALTGSNSYQNIASGSSTINATNTSYTLTWTVTSFTNPTYKLIHTTVSWTDRYNTAQTVALTTHVASIDPAYSGAAMQ